MSVAQPPRLRDYTNVPFEIFIAAFTILPFFLLAYFYSVLPDRVPLFMHLSGEVAEWAEKSFISVFRVPLLAVIMQIVCLLMKYGTIQSSSAALLELDFEQARLREQSFRLNASLWDWFRWTIAFKMIAESIDTIFLSFNLTLISRVTFIVTAIAALVGAAGAFFYCYKLLVVTRQLKRKFSDSSSGKPVDGRHVYGGFLYFNPSDPALFSRRYFFNFGNKWAWVYIACIIAYPLLVFWAS
jgi:uncharacterized membrane protein